jgi:alanine-glyoxylate transaminase/serine-glyoxylate transaminase/serine-pyruvate transaminase
MGVSVTDPNRDDIDRALVALKDGLVEAQAAMDLSSR